MCATRKQLKRRQMLSCPLDEGAGSWGGEGLAVDSRPLYMFFVFQVSSPRKVLQRGRMVLNTLSAHEEEEEKECMSLGGERGRLVSFENREKTVGKAHAAYVLKCCISLL